MSSTRGTRARTIRTASRASGCAESVTPAEKRPAFSHVLRLADDLVTRAERRVGPGVGIAVR